MTLVPQMEVVNHDAESLPLSTNSATERAAAVRSVLHHTTSRVEEDELLWMLGLHYRPEPPKARRHPMYSGKVIPVEAVRDGQ
ncbi:hypothetical protein ABH931_006087 [Streptacidiphilus sp. MAP12-33]|uniref:hypothetical protein n=1 Tax=Streptacidiphilus sp. MAP12-33 TaxID=3156266 RepID=UPI00351650A7